MPGTVTVACKVPNGLILRLFTPVKTSVPVLGGGFRDETIYQPDPSKPAVMVKGPARPIRINQHGDTDTEEAEEFIHVLGGYALTPGVDAEFFATWMEQNKDSDLVRSQLIFSSEKHETVEKKARERKDIKSGYEPLVPPAPGGKSKDPRWPKGIVSAENKPS